MQKVCLNVSVGEAVCFSKSVLSLSSPDCTDYDIKYLVFLPDLINYANTGLRQRRCSEINSR